MLLTSSGAALGAILRYLLTLAGKKTAWNWPLTTLLINLTGAFMLGLATHCLASNSLLMTFLGPGVLGGYTTFSTYNVELVTLIHSHRWRAATGYAVLSLAGGLLAAAIGLAHW
ncbi:fluoride efflux transporter FluC [Limosilactobacillus antri]|uniref:fluoride efflux transporter FluC n=1 Tax=Limosilactobacillus antri TaxID=227943 RepID=UPI001F58EA9C|nr:CrcB family protein [Limosilactobacillus antri]